MSSDLKYKFGVKSPGITHMNLDQLCTIDNWCTNTFGPINGDWILGKNCEWLFLTDELRSYFLLYWGHLL